MTILRHGANVALTRVKSSLYKQWFFKVEPLALSMILDPLDNDFRHIEPEHMRTIRFCVTRLCSQDKSSDK